MKTLKKLMVGFVLLAVLAMSAVSVYAQQSVAGSWTMSVPGMSLQMVLAQDGEKISGTLDSPHGVIQIKGEFSKGKLTLTGATPDSHALQISGSATLNADGSLSGSISANLMEMTFTAVPVSSK